MIDLLAKLRALATKWETEDGEPVSKEGLAALNTVNRLGRELRIFLDANAPTSGQDTYNAAYIKGRRDYASEARSASEMSGGPPAWLCQYDGSVHRRGVHHPGDTPLAVRQPVGVEQVEWRVRLKSDPRCGYSCNSEEEARSYAPAHYAVLRRTVTTFEPIVGEWENPE